MGGGGHRLGTIRLNIVSREKLFSADPGLRGDPPNVGNFWHFFALLKIPTIFLSAIIKFRKCTHDIARCPC